MKELLFLCLFFTITTLPLHSLEGWFIGFGAEANAHTRNGAAIVDFDNKDYIHCNLGWGGWCNGRKSP